MKQPANGKYFIFKNLFIFIQRVLLGFFNGNGFAHAGAIAYYSLLSIVPLSALILLGLSNIVDSHTLISFAERYLSLIVPAETPSILAQIEVVLSKSDVFGFVGFISLLLFSGLAFRVIGQSLSEILGTKAEQHRTLVFSALLPYLFLLAIACAILVISLVSELMINWGNQLLAFTDINWQIGELNTSFIFIFTFIGQVILIASFYRIMPDAHVPFRYALVGGFFAASLWATISRLMAWYYSSVSQINLIYGAFTTVIIILLTLEAAAIILLLGAHAIAEYQKLEKE